MTVSQLIQAFGPIPHPEGGYFKETYRSETITNTIAGDRHVCTGIYYLLENDDFLHFIVFDLMKCGISIWEAHWRCTALMKMEII